MIIGMDMEDKFYMKLKFNFVFVQKMLKNLPYC